MSKTQPGRSTVNDEEHCLIGPFIMPSLPYCMDSHGPEDCSILLRLIPV